MDPTLISLLIIVAVYAVVLLVGLPYLQSRRQRGLVRSLQRGDKVLVLNSIYGSVSRIDGDAVEVEIAPRVKVRCRPSAISRPRG